MKLSIIASANRGNELVITHEDFQEALGWMHEAEALMPQVFMEMVGRSEGQVMNELYHLVKSIYDSPITKGAMVRKGQLVNFLRNKVPAQQIDMVIKMACEAELIQQKVHPAGDIRYVPYPKPNLLKTKKA